MKEWLYWILEEDGRSHYVDEKTGIPSVSVDKRPLKNSPDSWKDISLGFQRGDRKSLGLINKFSIPLGFVLDGAKILRNIVYKSGFGRKIFLLITRRTIEFGGSTFKDYHTKFSRHQIEFVEQKDDEDKYTVSITDIGLARLIDLNKDTKYDFQLSDKEAVSIRFTGMNLHNTANFLFGDSFEIGDDIFGRRHAAPLSFITQDGRAANTAFFSQTVQNIPSGTTGATVNYLKNTLNYSLSLDVGAPATTYTITGKIKVTITKNDIGASVGFFLGSNYRTSVWRGAGGPADKMLQLGGAAGKGYTEILVNTTITLQPGEHLVMVDDIISLNNFGVGFKYQFEEGSELHFSYVGMGRPTTIRAYEPLVILDKILEKMTGKRGNVLSNLLNDPKYKGYLLSSGDGIRGLTDASVKLSLNDWINIYSLNMFASTGIEFDQFRVELIDHFLDPNQPIDLGEASTCVNTSAKEFMGNTLKIGHKYKEIEGVNGKMSFNNTWEYILPVDEVKDELDFTSPAIADPYAIEQVRIGLDGQTTTDSNKDSDLVLLVCEGDNVSFTSGELIASSPDNYIFLSSQAAITNRDFFVVGAQFTLSGTTLNNGTYTVKAVVDAVSGFNVFVNETVKDEVAQNMFIEFTFYKLKRYNWTSIEGVPSDAQIFNTDITPKRLYNLWERWFNSIMWKHDGQRVHPETTDQNRELKTNLNGVIVEEKADVAVGNKILFKPIMFEIDTMVPTSIFNILEQNPTRCFTWTWNSTIFKGFLMVGGVAPNNNKPQSYKLLCAPDQDLTNLID